MPIRPVLPVLLLASLLSSTAIAAGHTAVPPAETRKAPSTQPVIPLDAPDFLVGLVAARADDYAVSARAYSAALAADPNNSELLRQAFSEAALAGAPNAAELARKTIARPAGKSILTAFVLGNDAVLHDRWTEAAQAYGTMPVDALTNILSPLLQAWCLAGEKKYTDAISLLTSPARAISPAAPFYVGHAGLIAALAGDTTQAKKLYDKAATLFPGSDLLMNRARANLLWQTGHQSEARDLLRATTGTDTILSLAEPELQESIDTSPISSAKDGVAHAYVLVAFILRQQALHAPEAESMQQINVASAMMLRMALSLDPSLGIARLMLSEIEESLGHRNIAIAVLKDVPTTNPLTRVAQYSVALLQDQTGNRDEARKTLESLSHDAPTLVLPIRALGTLLFESKDWPGAITAFSKAIDNARASHTLDWSLLFERAAAYERAGDWNKAEADLQEARKMVPDEPLVLNFLGYGWIQRGLHMKEAQDLLQRALSLDPDDAAIRDSLGWAFLRNGNLNRGSELLEHAAEQTPLDPEVNYHLGVAYWDMGRKTEAIDQWNVALGLKPEADDKTRIENALNFAKTSETNTKFPIKDSPVTPPGPVTGSN
ncbi:tetratricopeptide repeat protein [Acetobacter conturbans]|uniref:Tetratricopeptide repeat protein n=1 Tax=Acetobacter conturbans TaxID=1737472 RepID=A0ABX0JZC6_9PROT|nr:tetratricopeptide repeat protein [Acetobacter conturbans]NHN88691.1 tetratricopeptide repeat protein [Acetobacter conturbans]